VEIATLCSLTTTPTWNAEISQFADGKIVRITIGYADKAEALKAVALAG
jgi:hypothetical protein